MSSAVLNDILTLIEKLSEDERDVVRRRLSEMLNAQWQDEAGAARESARRRGIDQQAIDRAVEEVRHRRHDTGIPFGLAIMSLGHPM